MDRTQQAQALRLALVECFTYLTSKPSPDVLYAPQWNKASIINGPVAYIQTVTRGAQSTHSIERSGGGGVRWFPSEMLTITLYNNDPISYMDFFRMWLASSRGKTFCALGGVRIELGSTQTITDDLGTSLSLRGVTDVTVTIQANANFGFQSITEIEYGSN